jgi:tetratricopeptide (TPR) repeat protein
VDEQANREALAYCEGRIRESPEDGVYWILKANCHNRLAEFEEAAAAYEKAIELGEVRSHANYFMAQCLIELGRLQEAVRALDAQLEITPDHPEALFLLGISLRTLGDREKGDKALARVEDIAPGIYAELYADYALALAEGVTDPIIKKGLEEAAEELRSPPRRPARE